MWINNKYVLTKNSYIELVDGELHFNFKNIKIMTSPEFRHEANQFITMESYKCDDEQHLFNAWKFLFFQTMISVERMDALVEDLYKAKNPDHF